ncbi:MAG: nitrogen fixation protein NifX [Acetobacteraceae bacterium]|nr:nitrogen fixation protein NifX [Acetobacteraceae bacterium]
MLAQRLELVETGEPAAGLRLRIAVATQDLKSLNAHFGSARRFAVYDVTPNEHRFVEAVSFGDVSNESGSHAKDGDDRIGPKVDALTGCHLLFVLAIGGPAAAKVVSAHIHPVKLSKPEPIEDIISRVQTMMVGNPPPWLRKVMGAKTMRSMDFLDEE